MTAPRAIAPMCLVALASGLAFGQSPDPAAERARLGNQRIQVEAERRAQEDLSLQDRAPDLAKVPEAARIQPTQARAANEPAEPRRPTNDNRTQRALEQLRDLGELKDAGYLTDEEFQRIKQRILDSHF